MMERKFTDDEIVKAYEACLCVNCRICPLAGVDDCGNRVEIGIPEIYNRQKAELDDLKRDTVPKLQSALDRANKYGVELEAENKLLKEEIKNLGITVNNTTEEFLKLHDDYQMQKAEIERLNHIRAELSKEIESWVEQYTDSQKKWEEAYSAYEETTGLKLARAETIKEFAKRLKCDLGDRFLRAHNCVESIIDNLVKEMTGENNGD